MQSMESLAPPPCPSERWCLPMPPSFYIRLETLESAAGISEQLRTPNEKKCYRELKHSVFGIFAEMKSWG